MGSASTEIPDDVWTSLATFEPKPVGVLMPGAETVGSTQNYEIMRAKIPDCELISYEGLPHNICDIVPDRCAADILGFLHRRFP